MSINSPWYVAAPDTVVAPFDYPKTLYRYQLLDIVRGLTYLHENDLVHGNLTGVNLEFLTRDEGADDLTGQYPGER